MILFLDFDGVLHPRYENGPVPVEAAFCHLPRFEAVMHDFPEVQIVISSTWREQFSLDKLRTWFSADIAARIVGATPIVPADHPGSLERRESEILAWLVEQGRSSEPWLALDDSTWQFRYCRDHLVACTSYVGLDGPHGCVDLDASILKISWADLFLNALREFMGPWLIQVWPGNQHRQTVG